MSRTPPRPAFVRNVSQKVCAPIKLYFRNIISKPKLNSYEVFELFEGDPLLILDPLLQPLEDVVIVLAIEEGEAEQDEGEVKLSDGRSAC